MNTQIRFNGGGTITAPDGDILINPLATFPAEIIRLNSQTISAADVQINSNVLIIAKGSAVLATDPQDNIFSVALHVDTLTNDGTISSAAVLPNMFTIVSAVGGPMVISGAGTLSSASDINVTGAGTVSISQGQINGELSGSGNAVSGGTAFSATVAQGSLQVHSILGLNGSIVLSGQTSVHVISTNLDDTGSLVTTGAGNINIDESTHKGGIIIDPGSIIDAGQLGGTGTNTVTIIADKTPKTLTTTPIPSGLTLDGNAQNGVNVFLGKNGITVLGDATIGIFGNGQVQLSAPKATGIQLGNGVQIISGSPFSPVDSVNIDDSGAAAEIIVDTDSDANAQDIYLTQR